MELAAVRYTAANRTGPTEAPIHVFRALPPMTEALTAEAPTAHHHAVRADHQALPTGAAIADAEAILHRRAAAAVRQAAVILHHHEAAVRQVVPLHPVDTEDDK